MFSVKQLTGLFPKKSFIFASCELSPLSFCSCVKFSDVGCLLTLCHGWKPQKLGSGDPWDAEGWVEVTQVWGSQLDGALWQSLVLLLLSCGAQSWLLQGCPVSGFCC